MKKASEMRKVLKYCKKKEIIDEFLDGGTYSIEDDLNIKEEK